MGELASTLHTLNRIDHAECTKLVLRVIDGVLGRCGMRTSGFEDSIMGCPGIGMLGVGWTWVMSAMDKGHHGGRGHAEEVTY